MRRSRQLLIGLVVMLFLYPALSLSAESNPSSYASVNSRPDVESVGPHVNAPPNDRNQGLSAPESEHILSDDSLTGNLEPVTVELSAFDMSNNLTARTDTGTNTMMNLTIDGGDGWIASEAFIELTNLRKLYAFNGTCEQFSPLGTSRFGELAITCEQCIYILAQLGTPLLHAF